MAVTLPRPHVVEGVRELAPWGPFSKGTDSVMRDLPSRPKCLPEAQPPVTRHIGEQVSVCECGDRDVQSTADLWRLGVLHGALAPWPVWKPRERGNGAGRVRRRPEQSWGPGVPQGEGG